MMEMTKKQQKNAAWIIAIISVAIAVFFIFRNGVQYLKNSYGIVLIIFTMLPVLAAILLTAKVSLFRWIRNINTVGLYFVFLVGIGLSYEEQSWIGLLFAIIVLIAFILLGMLVALIRTLRSCKKGKYYFTEEEHNKKTEYDSFGPAYKKYLSSTIEEGILEAILMIPF